MKKKMLLCSLMLIGLSFFGCSEKSDPPLPSAKQINAFVFKAGALNPELTSSVNGKIDENAKTVQVVVPEGIDLSALTPTISISPTATGIEPASGVPQNFNVPVKYTVTAADGTTAVYTVTVIATDTPVLTSFKMDDIPAVIVGKTIYCPVRIDEIDRTTRTLSIEGGSIEKLTIDGTEATDLNGTFTFQAFDAARTYPIVLTNRLGETTEYTLVLTGLPVVLIQIEGGVEAIPDDPKAPCGFTLIDPQGRTKRLETDTEGNVYYANRAGIERRGAYSQRFDKKSYSIEMQDDAGEEVDASFFGLRFDGDWILDAMWVDHARMRNRLCTDIWNTMNRPYHFDQEPEAVNGTRGYFVEVIINDEYRGLYCMTEKIDRKQLKVKKDVETGGVVFKGDQFSATTLFERAEGPIDNNADTWYGFEAEHPAEPGNMRWETIEELVKFVSSTDNPDDVLFAEQLNDHLDMGNVIDYLIFVNATCSHDNFGKNIFWSIYNTKKDKRFFCTPWDMDGSFGRNSDSGLLENHTFMGFGLPGQPAYNETELYKRLYRVNPDDFKTKLKTRWNELKTAQLAPATVAAQINAYKELFLKSGAYGREMNRWSEDSEFRCTPIEDEAQYMIDWYGRHYNALDSYINGL